MKKFIATTKTSVSATGSSPAPSAPMESMAQVGTVASERTPDSAGRPSTPAERSSATVPSNDVINAKKSSLPYQRPSTTAVSSSTTSSSPSSTTGGGAVKMCGYLKKKRNKMGGWRKLFFILQNQLLLSYSSRDDYEKKLAPFKDIINLVPGTIIIPTTGPRFTIETNSKLMYTFRCDDHRSCSEWIMALLDSLTLANGGLSADRNFSLHRTTLPITSYSLPSTCKPFAGAVGRSSGLPLELKSRPLQPSMLVRSGPPKPPRMFQPEFTERSRGSASSSSHESKNEDDLNNNNVLNGSPLEGESFLASKSLPKSADGKMSDSGDENDASRLETGPVETHGPGMAVKHSTPDQPAEREGEDRIKGVDEDASTPIETAQLEGAEKEKEEVQECAVRPKQQIFRLHQDVWSKAHRQSMDVCRINSMFKEHQSALIASVPSAADSTRSLEAMKSQAGASLHELAPTGDTHLYEDVGAQRVPLEPEPIYAVVDVRAKRSRRLARNLNTTAPDGTADSGNRKVSLSLPQISDGLELVTGTERRPVTARSCSNYDDYEDVNYLFAGHHRPTGDTETDSVGTDGSREQLSVRHESYGEEHIYEPIVVADRIPAISTGSSSSLPASANDHHHSHSLWRHLKRVHLQGSWRRLTQHRRTGPQKAEHQARSTTVAALEGLGRRLDSHRRSIKKRIKNLCERIDPVTSVCPEPERPVPATPELPEEGCECPNTEPAPETSTGVQSRKSLSLDSFLIAKGQQEASVPRG